MKRPQTDNGDEYRTGGFIEYCSEHGIRRVFSFRGTPQQNGIVERMSGTIHERAMNIRIHSRLPLSLWRATVDTTIL